MHCANDLFSSVNAARCRRKRTFSILFRLQRRRLVCREAMHGYRSAITPPLYTYTVIDVLDANRTLLKLWLLTSKLSLKLLICCSQLTRKPLQSMKNKGEFACCEQEFQKSPLFCYTEETFTMQWHCMVTDVSEGICVTHPFIKLIPTISGKWNFFEFFRGCTVCTP